MGTPDVERVLVDASALLEHLEALPVAVVQTDGEGCIRVWGGAAERIFGWSEEDALGKHIDALELVHEADIPFVDAVVNRLRSGHETRLVHRNRSVTRSGEVRHCEWTRLRLPAPRGGRAGLLCFVADVTAQVEAETSGRTAIAELDRWCRANPEGFCGLDRDWRITHWNPSAERMLEKQPAEVLGRELWEVFPELRETPFHQAFTSALEDGHLHILEERAPRGRSWYAVTVAPSPRGLFVFFRDVTGRRQMEQELLTAYAAAKQVR